MAMQTEDGARQSYERLSLALGASSACVWECDMRTDGVFLSEGWATLIGAPPGETRTTLKALMALVHPEDLDAALDVSLQAIKGLRDEYAVEHRVRTGSGDWRWILSRGRVTERGADGRALRLSGINIDVHGRKAAELALAESEVRYRSLIALSQHTYWETDTAHRLTGAGDASAIVGALPVAEQRRADLVFFEQMAELKQGGGIRHALAPKVNPAEVAKRRNVVQRILAGFISQIEPVGNAVHPQHPLHASGRSTVLRLRVVRLNQRTELSPRHQRLHARQKFRLAGRSTMHLESLRRRQRHLFHNQTLPFASRTSTTHRETCSVFP